MKTSINEVKRLQKIAGIIKESKYLYPLQEGKYFKTQEDAKAESDGGTIVYKVNPEEGSQIPEGNPLAKHVGKFVEVLGGTTRDGATELDSLKMWKEDGDSYAPTNEKLSGLKGAMISFLEAVASVKPGSPKKIKDDSGKFVDNPNYDPNAPWKVIKKF